MDRKGMNEWVEEVEGENKGDDYGAEGSDGGIGGSNGWREGMTVDRR